MAVLEKIVGEAELMIDISKDQIKNIIRSNYVLVIVESIFAFFILNLLYHLMPANLILIMIFGGLVPNVLVDILLRIKARKIFLDMGMLLLMVSVALVMTIFVNYFPEARPYLILCYVPSIIFSCTVSLSYGILNIVIIFLLFGGMTIFEILGYKFFTTGTINYSNMPSSWKIGMIFAAFFLAIIAVMSFYLSSVLRKRNQEISRQAKIIAVLLQKSKATSDQIVSSIKEILVVVDNDLRIIKFNEPFQELSGKKTDITQFYIGSFNSKIIINITKHLKDLQAKKRLLCG